MININEKIAEAMKAHDELRKEVYRAIKAEFLNWGSAKANVGKALTDVDEINILKKMVKQRQDSAEQYASRPELAEKEISEINIIKEFLPAEASPRQIAMALDKIISDSTTEPIKKNMGIFMKQLKTMFPTADGKMLSTMLANKLS